MSVAYSGAATYAQIAASVATRTDLVDALKGQLVATNGWGVVSGSSGSWILSSVITPHPAEIGCRVKIWDPGSGNCARVGIYNADGSIDMTAQPGYLLPGIAYAMYSNPYQFITQEETWSTTGRKFMLVSNLSVWDFMKNGSATECICAALQEFNADNDSEATSRPTLATSVCYQLDRGNMIWNSAGRYWAGAGYGPVGIPSKHASYDVPYRMAVDDSYLIEDAKIWTSTNGAADTFRCRGMLWDAIFVSGQYSVSDEITYDAKTWRNISASNAYYWSLFILKEE